VLKWLNTWRSLFIFAFQVLHNAIAAATRFARARHPLALVQPIFLFYRALSHAANIHKASVWKRKEINDGKITDAATGRYVKAYASAWRNNTKLALELICNLFLINVCLMFPLRKMLYYKSQYSLSRKHMKLHFMHIFTFDKA